MDSKTGLNYASKPVILLSTVVERPLSQNIHRSLSFRHSALYRHVLRSSTLLAAFSTLVLTLAVVWACLTAGARLTSGIRPPIPVQAGNG
jgi:hypothetical protein